MEHAFTHVRVSYHAVRCAPVAGEPAALGYDAWAWVAPEELRGYALPKAQQRIAALAAAE